MSVIDNGMAIDICDRIYGEFMMLTPESEIVLAIINLLEEKGLVVSTGRIAANIIAESQTESALAGMIDKIDQALGEPEAVSPSYKLIVEKDPDPGNPREEWDNMGTMVCFHSRYKLGDEHHYKNPQEFLKELASDAYPHLDEAIKADEDSEEDIIMGVVEKNYLMVPLYLYDHSGITMSTSPFSCPWDSGQVGWIYLSHKQVEHEYGDASPESLARAEKYLKGEAETYNQYLTGEVYGFRLLENGEVSDSCWGFFGSGDIHAIGIADHIPEEILAVAEVTYA